MWDEEKHPRDSDGKFCKVGLFDGSGEHADSVNKSDIMISRREFAIWYQKIGEIQNGIIFHKNKNGDAYIPVDNKIIITSGTYEKPKIEKILVFNSENELYMFLRLEEQI